MSTSIWSLLKLFQQKEIEDRLNAVMAEGVSICSAHQVEDGKASTAMALVAAADYFIQFREGKEPAADWRAGLDDIPFPKRDHCNQEN